MTSRRTYTYIRDKHYCRYCCEKDNRNGQTAGNLSVARKVVYPVEILHVLGTMKVDRFMASGT